MSLSEGVISEWRMRWWTRDPFMYPTEHHYQRESPLILSQKFQWAMWINTQCIPEENNPHLLIHCQRNGIQWSYNGCVLAWGWLYLLSEIGSFLEGYIFFLMFQCIWVSNKRYNIYVCVCSTRQRLRDRSFADRTSLLMYKQTEVSIVFPTDRRLWMHAHLVDEQSEIHKETIATMSLPTQKTCSFKMSNENCCKDSVFHSFKMGSSFHNYAQFMDSLHFGRKVRLFRKFQKNTLNSYCPPPFLWRAQTFWRAGAER